MLPGLSTGGGGITTSDNPYSGQDNPTDIKISEGISSTTIMIVGIVLGVVALLGLVIWSKKGRGR